MGWGQCGGNNRARTCDPLLVRQMLSQLSYAPTFFRLLRFRFVYLSNRLLYYTLILWICQVFFQNFQKNFRKPANGSVTQFMVYYIRLYSKKFRIGEKFFFRCGDLLYFILIFNRSIGKADRWNKTSQGKRPQAGLPPGKGAWRRMGLFQPRICL